MDNGPAASATCLVFGGDGFPFSAESREGSPCLRPCARVAKETKKEGPRPMDDGGPLSGAPVSIMRSARTTEIFVSSRNAALERALLRGGTSRTEWKTLIRVGFSRARKRFYRSARVERVGAATFSRGVARIDEASTRRNSMREKR